MNAILTRTFFEGKQTLGELELFDDFNCSIFKCKTLELPWEDNTFQISCIPTGCYQVTTRWSSKFKNHFHVLNVEGRSYILIHAGNYYTDILGCILVGDDHTDINNDGLRDVTNSKKTLKELRKLAPEGFELEII